MSRRLTQSGLSRKPLLSVEEVATLLDESRSTLYRSLKRGDLPLPVFTINGRLRIPRRAVERLIEGSNPSGVAHAPAPAAFCATCGGDVSAAPASRRPTCSAARRSS
ncbi:MAG: helix-turn-helix domain-containing protein, partial [Acidimicrobiales bacterium]